jgi:hypothetical protein
MKKMAAAVAAMNNATKVGNVENIAFVTRRFLSHLQQLAVMMLRCVEILTPGPSPFHGRGEQAKRSDNHHKGYEGRMGYHLEEHFVTLSRGWR